MRKNFPQIVHKLMKKDRNIFCILGDIGVFSFSKIFIDFKDRILNVGTLEQSMIGICAGLSKGNFIPIIHSISPFLVLRALEQIKIDLIANKLNCNIVTVGGSNDYAQLGITHHCFEDLRILSSYENINIFTPTNGIEFEYLFSKNYKKSVNYFRLTNSNNDIIFKENSFIKKKSNKNLIIFFGFYDQSIYELNYDIYYVNCLKPNSDFSFLKKYDKVYVIEPFFGNILQNYLYRKNINLNFIKTISYQNTILHKYGTKDEQDVILGFDIKNIKKSLK